MDDSWTPTGAHDRLVNVVTQMELLDNPDDVDLFPEPHTLGAGHAVDGHDVSSSQPDQHFNYSDMQNPGNTL